MAISLALFNYESDIGANISGSAKGPSVLTHSTELAELMEHFSTVESFKEPAKVKKLDAIPYIAKNCTKLAQAIIPHDFVVTLGGDHTSAIGTFSGIATQLSQQGDLGLLWIDAHLDSHTVESSSSKNPHGMPLAALLGYGSPLFTKILADKPKVKPENVCIVGVRSFEPEELAFLTQLNVKIFYMDEIKQRGLNAVMADAYKIVQNNTEGFGISLDLDAIDPKQAPGVSAPEANGIQSDELINTLKNTPNADKLMAMEIVEFNPEKDVNHATEIVATGCLKAILQAKHII